MLCGRQTNALVIFSLESKGALQPIEHNQELQIFKCFWKLRSPILSFAFICGQSKTALIFKRTTSKGSPKFFFTVFRAAGWKIPFEAIAAITRFSSRSNKLISVSIRRLSSRRIFDGLGRKFFIEFRLFRGVSTET